MLGPLGAPRPCSFFSGIPYMSQIEYKLSLSYFMNSKDKLEERFTILAQLVHKVLEGGEDAAAVRRFFSDDPFDTDPPDLVKAEVCMCVCVPYATPFSALGCMCHTH